MAITSDFQSEDESSILSICSQIRLLLIHRATYCDHRIKGVGFKDASREVHLNKTCNGESVDLRNGKYQRSVAVSIKRLHVAILEISYGTCARKATKTKFEKA